MLINEVGYELNPMSSSHTCRCNTVELFCLLKTSSITMFYHFVIFQNQLPWRGIERSQLLLQEREENELRCPQQRLKSTFRALS